MSRYCEVCIKHEATGRLEIVAYEAPEGEAMDRGIEIAEARKAKFVTCSRLKATVTVGPRHGLR